MQIMTKLEKSKKVIIFENNLAKTGKKSKQFATSFEHSHLFFTIGEEVCVTATLSRLLT